MKSSGRSDTELATAGLSWASPWIYQTLYQSLNISWQLYSHSLFILYSPSFVIFVRVNSKTRDVQQHLSEIPSLQGELSTEGLHNSSALFCPLLPCQSIQIHYEKLFQGLTAKLWSFLSLSLPLLSHRRWATYPVFLWTQFLNVLSPDFAFLRAPQICAVLHSQNLFLFITGKTKCWPATLTFELAQSSH